MSEELGSISGSIVIKYDDRGVAQAEKGVKGFTKSTQDASQKSKEAWGEIRVASTVAAAAVLAGAVLMGKQLYTLGINLDNMDRKASAVFEGELPRIHAWAAANKNALGLTETGAVNAAASLADLLKPMGFTARQATDMSIEILNLSGALASWSGGTYDAAQVSEILRKALLGEREQLETLGIKIMEADVSARLATKGQEGLTGAALAQAQALATQELILEKSIDAQRAWANGGQEAAEAVNAGKVSVQELNENLARSLAPTLEVVAKAFGVMADFAEKHTTAVKIAGTAIVALAAVVLAANAAYKAYAAGLKIVELAQFALSRRTKEAAGAVAAQRALMAGPLASALGAAGVAVGILAVAWALHNRKQQEAKQYVKDLSTEINAQTGALTENGIALRAQALLADKDVKWLLERGVAEEDLVGAINGEANAIANVNKWKEQASTVGKKRVDRIIEEYQASEENAKQLANATAALGAETVATQDATVAAEELAAQLKEEARVAAEVAEAVRKSAEDHGESIREMAGANEALEDANAKLRDDQKLTTEAFLDEFAKRQKIAAEHNDNIVLIQRRASDDVRDQMLEDAAENPELAALMVNATDKEWRRMEKLYRTATRTANNAANDELIRNIPALSRIAGTAGQEAARRLADRIRSGGPLTVAEVNSIMQKAKTRVEGTELLAVIDSKLDARGRAAAERQLNYLARNRTAYINAQIVQSGGVNSPQLFQHGGIVAGQGPVPVIAHGGERILSPDQTKDFHRLLASLGQASIARRADRLALSAGPASAGGILSTSNVTHQYTLQPGAISVDASKLRRFDDVVGLIDGVRSTSRKFVRK